MSRILITGSHGLVGTAMKSMLTSAGHNVRSLDFRAPQGDGGGDVVLLEHLDELEGLTHHHARGLADEVLVGAALVDGDLAGAGRHEDAGHRGLALAGGVNAARSRGFSHGEPQEL